MARSSSRKENVSSYLKASTSLEGPCKERIKRKTTEALKQEEICQNAPAVNERVQPLTGNYSLIYWQKNRTNILKFQIGTCAYHDCGHDEQFTFIIKVLFKAVIIRTIQNEKDSFPPRCTVQ